MRPTGPDYHREDPRLRPALFTLPVVLSLALTLPGCAIFGDAPHYRGIAITPLELSELTPGVSTEADAQALIGPPTFEEQFDANNWVYVSQVTKMRIGNTEGVERQHVVVLAFDNTGTLRGVSQKDLDQGVRVAMDGSQTPTPGGHAGFIQQLIGGVGSYNPGIAPSSGAAGGAGAGAGGRGGHEGDIGAAGGGGGF